jgi:hypothetical protein
VSVPVRIDRLLSYGVIFVVLLVLRAVDGDLTVGNALRMLVIFAVSVAVIESVRWFIHRPRPASMKGSAS